MISKFFISKLNPSSSTASGPLDTLIDGQDHSRVSNTAKKAIAQEDVDPEQPDSSSDPATSPFPRDLAERSAYVRKDKDGKKGTKVTAFQWKLYDLLLQVPPGKVSTYGQLSTILSSSPRAVGSALRNNPFAPDVPCHRIIASNGYIAGFGGEWNKKTKKGVEVKAGEVVQGPKVSEKLKLLKEEGVKFDSKGMLKDKGNWWKGPV